MRERKISWLPLVCAQPGIQPATQPGARPELKPPNCCCTGQCSDQLSRQPGIILFWGEKSKYIYMVPKSKPKEYSEESSSHPSPPSGWGSPHPKQETTATNSSVSFVCVCVHVRVCIPSKYQYALQHHRVSSFLLNKMYWGHIGLQGHVGFRRTFL